MKKRGSSHATTDSTKVKKNAHAGNVQNVNSSREALSQEGSDQQVKKSLLILKFSMGHLALTIIALKILSLKATSVLRDVKKSH